MTTSHPYDPMTRPTGPEARTRGGFAAWPLLMTLCGLLALVVQFCESRPDGTGDFDYPVTSEDVMGLDHTLFRISGALGYVLALLLLFCAVVWKHRVERRFPDSRGATLVTYGVLACSALVALAYGWRASLGNYLPSGSEGDLYDAEGVFTYYVMNDFSAYIAFVPLLAAAYGIGWMAFGDGIVSRGLGAGAVLFASALLIVTFVTGVPGIPAMIVVGLIVAGVWLSFGRSAITQPRGDAA